MPKVHAAARVQRFVGVARQALAINRAEPAAQETRQVTAVVQATNRVLFAHVGTISNAVKTKPLQSLSLPLERIAHLR